MGSFKKGAVLGFDYVLGCSKVPFLHADQGSQAGSKFSGDSSSLTPGDGSGSNA